jgi:hypothetical protein
MVWGLVDKILYFRYTHRMNGVLNKTDSTYWHPVLSAALRLELEPYLDVLEFKVPFALNAAPLEIDTVVIKKIKDIEIKENIADVFKNDNIIEFKGVGDYLSVQDFYKVYAYACLYLCVADNVAATDISITMIETRHPREMIKHLREVRNYEVTEKYPGIYHVTGDFFPIQIIETQRLEETEHRWLGNIKESFDPAHSLIFSKDSLIKFKQNDVETYYAAILDAFTNKFTEASDMEFNPVFVKKLEERGWTKKWEAEGETKRATEDARRALALGLSVDMAQKISGLDRGTVQGLAGK